MIPSTALLDKSHTLSHEVGHFFNLKHPWGSTNSAGVSCGNDNVSDTPQTMGWSSCNLSGATCGSPLDNVQNFMDYSYCSCMFTAGQKSRMIAAANNGFTQRNNLWSSANLSATGVSGTPVPCSPIADFKTSTQFICAGASVQFTDLSFNGIVATRAWTVTGGTASSLSDSVITVTYNTPGTYSVTLNVSNAVGADVVTKNSIVIVLSTTAMYSNGYIEDFENDVLPEADWTPVNNGSGTFSITNNAHYTGTKSLAFFNSVNYVGQISDAVGPTLNMTSIGNPMLTFHVAFAKRTSTDVDILRLMVSTDCGKTWAIRYVKSGSALATVTALNTGSFIPGAGSWRMETVTLNSFATNTDLRIKFEFLSGGGNNLFIDDINLGGFSFADAPLANNGLQIFPNPATDAITIQSFDGNTPRNILVADASGRTITQFTPVNSSTEMNINSFAAGVYFVKVKMIDGSILIRKFVKN